MNPYSAGGAGAGSGAGQGGYGAGGVPSYSVKHKISLHLNNKSETCLSFFKISYGQQQSTAPSKADTLHLLSSLAPSLLLSGLLLPLSLALLTNVSGLVTGRKKRDLLNMQDNNEEDFDDDVSQVPLEFDDLDSKIAAKDGHFLPATNALLDSYSPGDADRLLEFVREKGLLDKSNTCLQKMACLATLSKTFKKSDKIQK